MRNKKDYYVVSVESRKGGVGKTSVALNLARILVSSGKYEVLFLDLDIVGTEAAKCIPALQEVNESFSEDLLCVIKSANKKKPDKVLNLIETFESYMAGKPLIKVQWDGKPGNDVVLKKDKVNIFSSNLCGDPGSGEGRGYIYGPATLFDDMHSQWFITMIKDFVGDCVEKLYSSQDNPDKKLVVVIDNAPGYSGLAPVVEEWLTDIGPKFGKFLFVCSIDTQDMTACLQSLQENYKLYSGKWEMSRNFIDMYKKGKKVEKYWGTNNGNAFFNRLAESIPNDYDYCQYGKQDPEHLECPECGLCFYRQENGDIGEEYIKNPLSFLALVANRVPRSVYEGNLTIKKDEILSDMGFEIEIDLKPKNQEKFIKSKDLPVIYPGKQILENLQYCTIPHKDKMSLQFAAKRLARDVNRETQGLIEKLDKNKFDFSDSFEKFQRVDLSAEKAFKNSIEEGIRLELEFHNKIKEARKLISKPGIQGVEKFWDERFSILFANLEFVNNLGKINESGNVKYTNITMDELISKLKRLIEYKDEISIVAEDLDNILRIPEVKNMGIPLNVLRDMGLSAVIVFDDCFNMDGPKCKEIVIILCYMYMVCYKWENQRGSVDINSPLYWLKHGCDRRRVTDAKNKIQIAKILDNVVNSCFAWDKYPDLYMKFCMMKARLMYAAMDFDLLIKIFKRIILEKNPDEAFQERIKKLAEKMIVEKNFFERSREEIMEEMAGSDFKEFELIDHLISLKGEKGDKFFIPKEEITVFDKVIKRILKEQWKWDLM